MSLARALVIMAVASALGSTDPAGAAPVYRWTDAAGRLHFSNGVGDVPRHATVAAIAALDTISRPTAPKANGTPAPRLEGRVGRSTSCGFADAAPLAAVVAERVGRARLAELNLFVSDLPVSSSADTIVQLYRPHVPATLWSDVDAGVPAAYPGGGGCPSRPPLTRAPVVSVRPGGKHELCDDYRRAFTEVGVAANRNGRNARPFREIAERFAAIAADGYETRGLGFEAVSPTRALTATGGAAVLAGLDHPTAVAPWIVDAHVAQMDELARESEELVDELTVALEEIDRAARAARCW
jgi:hypothetical protein